MYRTPSSNDVCVTFSSPRIAFTNSSSTRQPTLLLRLNHNLPQPLVGPTSPGQLPLPMSRCSVPSLPNNHTCEGGA